MITSNYRS